MNGISPRKYREHLYLDMALDRVCGEKWADSLSYQRKIQNRSQMHSGPGNAKLLTGASDVVLVRRNRAWCHKHHLNYIIKTLLHFYVLSK